VKRLGSLLLVTTLAVSHPARLSPAASRSESRVSLERPVSDFNNDEKPLVPTLLLIARAYAIPIGIEKVTPEALHQPIRLEFHKTTLGQLLDATVGSLPDYAWGIDDGVVNIYGKEERAGGSNLLNLKLAHFDLADGTINDANARLRQAVWSIPPAPSVDSGVYSTFGDSPGIGALEGRKFTFAMRNATVRDVLNRLVRISGNIAWVATVPPSELNQDPPSGLWKLVPLSAN
jgi:hypothetical protein